MHNLKTVQRILKCIQANVAIYKSVCGVELRVSPIQLYKMTLIEILSNTRDGLLYTYVSSAEVDALILKQEEDKLAVPPVKPASITTPPVIVSVATPAANPVKVGNC